MITPILANNGIPGELIPLVAIVMTFVWLIVKALVSPFVRKKSDAKAEAADLNLGGKDKSSPPAGSDLAAIRQMQATLTRMESRVEALETILIERARK